MFVPWPAWKHKQTQLTAINFSSLWQGILNMTSSLWESCWYGTRKPVMGRRGKTTENIKHNYKNNHSTKFSSSHFSFSPHQVTAAKAQPCRDPSSASWLWFTSEGCWGADSRSWMVPLCLKLELNSMLTQTHTLAPTAQSTGPVFSLPWCHYGNPTPSMHHRCTITPTTVLSSVILQAVRKRYWSMTERKRIVLVAGDWKKKKSLKNLDKCVIPPHLG